MTPLSPVSDPDPHLQVLLEQVQEFLGTGGPATIPTPIVVPTPATVPIDVLPPAPSPEVPPRGSRKGKGMKAPVRRGSLQKFRDGFKVLLTKFSRASREPVTLSSGLVPEREENAEITGKRYVKLFG